MHAHLPSLERQTELTALLQLMERIMVLLSSNERIVTRLSAPALKVYPGFVNGRSAPQYPPRLKYPVTPKRATGVM
jgi:hypothetical protein